MGDAAHELSHRRQFLRLLQLRLGAALLRDIADQGEHLGDATAFPHGREQHLRGAVTSIGPLERNLEPAQLAIEGSGQILPRNPRPR